MLDLQPPRHTPTLRTTAIPCKQRLLTIRRLHGGEPAPRRRPVRSLQAIAITSPQLRSALRDWNFLVSNSRQVQRFPPFALHHQNERLSSEHWRNVAPRRFIASAARRSIASSLHSLIMSRRSRTICRREIRLLTAESVRRTPNSTSMRLAIAGALKPAKPRIENRSSFSLSRPSAHLTSTGNCTGGPTLWTTVKMPGLGLISRATIALTSKVGFHGKAVARHWAIGRS